MKKEELPRKVIEMFRHEAENIESGSIPAAKVVEWGEDENGEMIRREISPKIDQVRARSAWEAKTEVAELRHHLDLSQKAFAAMLGVPLPTLRKWEGNKTKPSGAAASLLKIVRAKPEVLEILKEETAQG